MTYTCFVLQNHFKCAQFLDSYSNWKYYHFTSHFTLFMLRPKQQGDAKTKSFVKIIPLMCCNSRQRWTDHGPALLSKTSSPKPHTQSACLQCMMRASLPQRLLKKPPVSCVPDLLILGIQHFICSCSRYLINCHNLPLKFGFVSYSFFYSTVFLPCQLSQQFHLCFQNQFQGTVYARVTCIMIIILNMFRTAFLW